MMVVLLKLIVNFIYLIIIIIIVIVVIMDFHNSIATRWIFICCSLD